MKIPDVVNYCPPWAQSTEALNPTNNIVWNGPALADLIADLAQTATATTSTGRKTTVVVDTDLWERMEMIARNTR